MKQNRTNSQDQDAPNRSSNMEQAEGSRDSASSSERMRNRESSPKDLGSSSDRAMFSDRDSAESRDSGERESMSGGASSERGMGSSSERNRGESGESSRSRSGGISNRDLEREQCEQDRVPDRGSSQSDR